MKYTKCRGILHRAAPHRCLLVWPWPGGFLRVVPHQADGGAVRAAEEELEMLQHWTQARPDPQGGQRCGVKFRV